jgi:hypothetical protein
MIHEKRMEHRRWQFDVAEMTRAAEIRLSTCNAAVQMMRDTFAEVGWVYTHVLFIYGTQSRVIQAPEVWPVQVIKKDWVRDLLDRYSSNIFGGQNRERYALNS